MYQVVKLEKGGLGDPVLVKEADVRDVERAQCWQHSSQKITTNHNQQYSGLADNHRRWNRDQ